MRRAKKVSLKRGPGDHFQARRIAALYERALSRFGDDSRLWLDYVSYLKKTNQPKAVGRVLARACRANATSLDPWLAAARWELKDRGNATAARRLLQRALRFNGEKHELWSHYIAFELSYVDRLRKRSAALGTPSPEVELTQVAVEAARAAFQAVAVDDRGELLASIEKACASIGGHVGSKVAEAARAAAGDAPPSLPPPPPPTGPSKARPGGDGRARAPRRRGRLHQCRGARAREAPTRSTRRGATAWRAPSKRRAASRSTRGVAPRAVPRWRTRAACGPSSVIWRTLSHLATKPPRGLLDRTRAPPPARPRPPCAVAPG